MTNDKPIKLTAAELRVRARCSEKTKLEDLFIDQMEKLGVPAWEREHQFAKPRRWRFDFAWPDRKLAVEIDGGTWSGGRHVRGAGYRKDCVKLNTAALRGWTVLRYTSDVIRSGAAAREVAAALKGATA